ncbi:uncharacterized protein TNCV_3521091 [Trichonephila clavipes]|nr:uncharacterized protein TNCV_3521091 [Trichonephila clavipes]
MPGNRARRHFSQLSEFERGLIIGMKTAGWSTRRVAGQVDRFECAIEIVGSNPRAENRVWRDQEDHEERGSKDHVASTCGPHSDSFNDTSRRRRSNCSTNNFQTPRKANLKSKRPFCALPLTPEHLGNCVYSGAKPDQCGISQIGKRLCLVMNPGLFWGQMITV